MRDFSSGFPFFLFYFFGEIFNLLVFFSQSLSLVEVFRNREPVCELRPCFYAFHKIEIPLVSRSEISLPIVAASVVDQKPMLRHLLFDFFVSFPLLLFEFFLLLGVKHAEIKHLVDQSVGVRQAIYLLSVEKVVVDETLAVGLAKAILDVQALDFFNGHWLLRLLLADYFLL